MFKIHVLNKIANVGLTKFPKNLYDISDNHAHPDAILVRSHSMHDMSLQDSVKVVGRAGAGTNNIPVNELTRRGIPILNTPGANANAVRELVIAGMLLASRNICQAWHYVQQLENDHPTLHQQIEQDKKRFSGSELLGKTLGIIGLGSIGVRVANAALTLGMRVIGYDPAIAVERAWELSAEVEQAHQVEDLLAHADFVSIHVPLNDKTKNMLDATRLNVMKIHAVLLNFARDGIIDNQALLTKLNAQQLKAYVNDFPVPEFLNHPSVISLPHLGASTKEAEENCAIMIAKQLRDYLEHGAITNSINFPNVDVPPHTSGVRLAIVNANIPKMVAQVSAKLAEIDLNITSLTNKSRGDIAYTLIDVQDEVQTPIIEEIKKIPGIIQVRKIVPTLS